MYNKKRDFKNSRFSTTIGVKPEHKEKLKNIKGKKSLAGKLEEILDNFFKWNNEK